MSRIAKKPITFPSALKLSKEQNDIQISGDKGVLSLPYAEGIQVQLDDGQLQVQWDHDSHMALAGTYRAILQNYIIGLTEGFKTTLEIRGTGYRATMSGEQVQFQLGKSHMDHYLPPSGIKITLPKPTVVVIEGIDKQKVNQVAAEIQRLRPPNAYKARGIYRQGQPIKLKEVKKK